MAPFCYIARAIHRTKKEIINKQAEVDQPVLTEEQMEQMNFTLIEVLHTNKQVYLTYSL
ncbi:YolD-like family protein [Priestia megaterium]|uniref:YolD-like family protein n=1 Tax=Priestia megaterium TaxID=1404 RepID=UPI00207AFDB7|nr:YolD-like family protein [Priestia megaterium]USL27999.1 YolD-like family protein [Priestia megaterium]